MTDDALRQIISDTASRPAVGRAVRALVYHLATTPTQHDGVAHYVELAIGYVAKLAGVSHGSAWSAWHTVRGAVGWSTLHKYDVEPRGFRVRPLSRGQRWGQHLLLTEPQRRACASAARFMVAAGLHDGEPPGGRGAEWRPVEIVGRMARCPYHDDHTPSMIVNRDEGGGSALGVCMACTRNDKRLTAQLRRFGSRWFARLCGSSATRSTNARKPAQDRRSASVDRLQTMLNGYADQPTTNDEPTRTDERLPTIRPTGGAVLLGKLGDTGLSGTFAAGDVLATLRNADRRAVSDRCWGDAMIAADRHQPGDDPRRALPDRLVSVSDMVVAEWRTFTRADGSVFRQPARFRPASQRWALFDVDKLTDARTASSASFLDTVADIADRDRWLSGRWAVVRTSDAGVQVWLELADVCDPVRLARSVVVRSWLRGVGAEIRDGLRDVGAGSGLVDESAWSVHRFGRRPGWRLLSDGTPYLSRLVAACDGSGGAGYSLA